MTMTMTTMMAESSSSPSYTSSSSGMDIAVSMSMILGTLIAIIGGLTMIQAPNNNNSKNKAENGGDEIISGPGGVFLPSSTLEPSKRAYEIYVLAYTPIWILCFAIIVACQLYKDFDEWSYLKVCVGLALPFLLQPVIFPSATIFGSSTSSSPDKNRPLYERYSFKANLWIAIYSFIGNYWYTHYFYSVLKAKYTMPAHRLNNVPIALYFATHFYFTTYHAFSNMMLRKITTTYQPGISRSILFWFVVFAFAYFTAFMETLTISSYPDYSFENRDMAYKVGSAFYGIYFIVSFPAFYYFDNHIDNNNNSTSTTTNSNQVVTAWDTIVSSCGYGMMILCLLDFVRLVFDIPLVVGSSNVICSLIQ